MVQNGFGPHDYCAELIKKHGIKKVIAEKLLTTNQRPWITFPDAFKKIDDLRQEKDADQKFLKDYDLFLQGLQAKHEQNI